MKKKETLFYLGSPKKIKKIKREETLPSQKFLRGGRKKSRKMGKIL